MIAEIILSSLVLLLILALWQRIWVKLGWGPAGGFVDVRYLLIHVRMPRSARKRKKKPKKKRERREKSVRPGAGALGWIKLAPELLRTVSKDLKFLLPRIELRRLRLGGRIEAENAATTATLWGAMQAVNGALQPWGSKLEFTVMPDFSGGGTNLTFDASAGVRVITLLGMVAISLWYLPKWKLLRLLWTERRRQKKASAETGLKEVQFA